MSDPILKSWFLTLEPNSRFQENNRIEIPGVAFWLDMANNSEGRVLVRFNDDQQNPFRISPGGGWGFHNGDLVVRVIDFENPSDKPAEIEIIAGVKYNRGRK